MINPTIRNAVRFALTAGVAASFVNAPAFAADDDDSTKLDRVEVTGLRIKRTQLEGAMPVTTVTREDIEKTGLSNIGDLLQELPSAGASLNTNFNNGGSGATTIDLRNLGSNRVLVLVNGRRWVDNVGSGLGSSVDLNTIPITIIERVEVLKDGASAVYGSDAIAGVINIITRRDFDGAQANATIGEFDEGDGRQELYDFSVGSSGSRASAFFNVTYYKQEAVFAGDREISKEPQFGTGYGAYNFDSQIQAGTQVSATDSRCENHAIGTGPYTSTLTPITAGFFGPGGGCGAFGSGTTPNGRFSIRGTVGAFPGGTVTRGSQAFDTVTPGAQFADFFAFGHANRYNFAPDNYMATPGERYSLFASGRYDITDNVTFVTEVLYNKRESDQKLAAMPVIVGSAAGAVLADGRFIGIDATNPYNFTLRNLIPAAYCATTANPGGIPCNSGAFPSATNSQLNFVARRFVEGGTRNFYQAVQTWRFGAGFEGNFEAVGRVWDWNVNYVYAISENSERQQGLFDTTKILQALGPLANCIGTCVALDLFGGLGSLTPAMLEYVGSTTHDVQQSELRNYTGNISGELFDLPAGPVGLAAGYEYRQQSGLDEPDGLLQGGNSTGNNRQATNGGYAVSELYAEFAIPILKDAPLAEDLELSFAIRASDYDSVGSTTNTKFGLRWQPFNDLLVRATFQEGFRAPNINELFAGSADSYPTLNEPCSQSGTRFDTTPELALEAQVIANCTGQVVTLALAANVPGFANAAAAVGTWTPAYGPNATTVAGSTATGLLVPFVPLNGGALNAASSYAQANTQIRITVGANPNLAPETSESTTFGFVYSPSYVDGLSLSLDWFNIQIDGGIAGLGFTSAINNCYQVTAAGALFTEAETAAALARCDLLSGSSANPDAFTRTAQGEIADLIAIGYNTNSIETTGLDLNVVYRAGELPLIPGEFKFTWDTSYVQSYTVDGVEIVGFNGGDGSIPKFKSNFTVDWSWGDWEASWRVRFIGAQTENCSATFEVYGLCSGLSIITGSTPSTWTFTGTSTNHLGATTYHNVQVSYNISDWDTRLTFGIQNIGDKAPPISTQSFANSFDPTTYEVPGMFPYLRISKTF